MEDLGDAIEKKQIIDEPTKLAEINAKFFSPDFTVTYDDIAECDENIPEEYLPEGCDPGSDG